MYSAAASHRGAQTLRQRCCPSYPGDRVIAEGARERVTALLCILNRLFRNKVALFLLITTKQFHQSELMRVDTLTDTDEESHQRP